jgi:hypothetical protein
VKQRSIPPELLDAFYSFLEYTDPKILLRILRIQFIEYCGTLQDGIPDNYDSYIYHLDILFEFLDAVEDYTPFKYENG